MTEQGALATTSRDPRPGGAPKADSPARLSVQTLTREARKVMADLDMEVSQNRLVKIILRFIREGRSDIDFRTWFISYADPTGETAARHVDRERGSHDAA